MSWGSCMVPCPLPVPLAELCPGSHPLHRAGGHRDPLCQGCAGFWAAPAGGAHPETRRSSARNPGALDETRPPFNNLGLGFLGLFGFFSWPSPSFSGGSSAQPARSIRPHPGSPRGGAGGGQEMLCATEWVSKVQSPPADPSWRRPDLRVGGKFPGARDKLDLEHKHGVTGPVEKRKKERK